jgi:hypothetical protein
MGKLFSYPILPVTQLKLRIKILTKETGYDKLQD